MHAAWRGGPDCRLAAGHGEERTPNMPRMDLTLEVSKLSGWLNADAYCRESKGGHTIRCVGRGADRQAGGGGRPRRTQRAGEGAAVDWKQGTRGGAHVEHVAHVCDAGGFEAQWLVERRRALKQGARGCEGYQAQAACRGWVQPEVEGTGQAWSAPGTSGTCL